MAKEEELSHRIMPFWVQRFDDLMVDDGMVNTPTFVCLIMKIEKGEMHNWNPVQSVG